MLRSSRPGLVNEDDYGKDLEVAWEQAGDKATAGTVTASWATDRAHSSPGHQWEPANKSSLHNPSVKHLILTTNELSSPQSNRPLQTLDKFNGTAEDTETKTPALLQKRGSEAKKAESSEGTKVMPSEGMLGMMRSPPHALHEAPTSATQEQGYSPQGQELKIQLPIGVLAIRLGKRTPKL
ncbi:hypothetical protein llap_10021 [Limosa lapponica baueri]|uniref:Uncharacterized protein n=1 Tax=Limosa lapponica baueri TaxID=1758121 RepID=A0A2I0U165_LIMLA|nr:hypothetical protein llap_10021 [Limosa lapponica baueri]